MTRVILKCPQARREPISSLSKAAKPNLEPRLRRSLLSASSGGWRRCRGLSRKGEPGIGDRTRRPRRSRSNVSRRLRARLRRLSRPPSLPGGIERHLPHLTDAVFRRPRNHKGLVDPRLELIQRRHGAGGNDPIVRDVSLRSLDTRQFTIEEGGNSVL
jgi:hypothetical protein